MVQDRKEGAIPWLFAKLPDRTSCAASVILYAVRQSACHAVVYLLVTPIDVWTSTRRKTPIHQRAPLQRSSPIEVWAEAVLSLLLNDAMKGPFCLMY
ncbi:uncharacterized protein ARMOST_19617 [Armillaria ostoyae]|uniref:Uncharacterized protein n=1 Tax=Armillaria ostoyae TaxID=47428 RepID=A0A284S515_ARMOS|nr:uncharacterized protein ARMOST_19617 [Armillaria ostoyae]